MLKTQVEVSTEFDANRRCPACGASVRVHSDYRDQGDTDVEYVCTEEEHLITVDTVRGRQVVTQVIGDDSEPLPFADA